jgi:two-component system nitrate/nitrite sensor histidine kinase NarX
MSIKTKFYVYFLLIALLSFVFVWKLSNFYQTHHLLDALLVLFAVLGYAGVYWLVRKDFLLPFGDLQTWVMQSTTNQLVRPNTNKKSTFQPVTQAINHLIDENQHLYDDMEQILNKQVQRLSKKTASLETLYSTASALNKTHTKTQLFSYFLEVFVNMTGAHAAAVRVLGEDGNLHLTEHFGALDACDQEALVASCDCFCGEVALAQNPIVQFSTQTCAKCVGKKTQNLTNVGTITIPLKHHGKTLGLFNLFFDQEPSLAAEERALLEAIADNIAIALDKIILDEQTKRLALSQERLFLSQEIHDSLAQTIYSLQLQVSVLAGSLNAPSNAVIDEQVLGLKSSIRQANRELRALMGNFRMRLDIEGIEVSLQKILQDFEAKEGIATYVQIKGKITTTPEMEMQIVRIIQEALSNIRKHAKARNVRVLLRTQQNGVSQLLIEDDGKGFDKQAKKQNDNGNNIGIKIMQERAQRMGAKLEIESDIDEGTRIILHFGGQL